MGESGNVLQIEPAVLFLQVVAFVILFLVLRKYLFVPVLGVMEQREKEVVEALDAGERARDTLSRIEEERTRVLAEARDEGREAIQNSVREGEQARERILREAREEAHSVRQRARESAALEREEALLALRHQVVELALLAADQAVLSELDEEKHRRVVDEFIARLEREG
jgi:F-type H+-transporting ATPase subunit b